MIFAERSAAEVSGGVLAHSLSVSGQRWQKGRQLTAADGQALTAAGMAAVLVAMPEAGDVPEDSAAQRIAELLAGSGIAIAPPAHGRVNLIAKADGLAGLDARLIATLNLADDAVTVGTVRPYDRVAAGDIVATIKIIPFFVAGRVLDRLSRMARGAIRLYPFLPLKVGLVHTRLPALKDSVIAKTRSVTAARLAAIGSQITCETVVAHESAAVAAALAALDAVDLVLVVGASAITDVGDVIPAGILAAGGRIERVGMPVDPGNLLCLGFLGDTPVIGLPGCARAPKRNGFDWVLERLAAGLAVTRHDIALMGVGGLIDDSPARLVPRRMDASDRSGPVGVLLLAAGKSSRMGGTNKLLAPFGPSTVAAASLANARAAGLAGVVAVVGHQAEAVGQSLAVPGVTVIACPDYADGLSASLKAGLAHVPADWAAVVIALGDMPLVPPEVFGALVSAWRAGGPDVCIPVHQGKRGNPVLWGRAHFDALRRLDGDVGAKAVLASLGDQIAVVDVATPGIFQDIDTPADLDALNPDR